MLMFLTIITFAAFYFAVESKKINLVYIDTFIVGFFLIPLVPVMLELSCEVIYPLNGSFAVGMLLSGATLFTVIMG
jgi:FLVCR family feline leukemia virus subgroup C receptor-related protein